jgi:hypothetical protein
MTKVLKQLVSIKLMNAIFFAPWIQVINATAFKRREANFFGQWPKS